MNGVVATIRISSGYLRGRIVESPKNKHTHPMGERVRSGLFNALGDIEGLSVLDGLAGSGILGFEAVSRGASKVVAIESDRQAQRSIRHSITSLGLASEVKLIKASADAWLKTSSEEFDLVLLDPPYDDLQPELLAKLADRTLVSGTIVLSLPPRSSITLPTEFKLLLSKNYGDAKTYFYKRLT